MMKTRYAIWMLKDIPENAKRLFSNTKMLRAMGEEVNSSNYEKVYEGEIEHHNVGEGDSIKRVMQILNLSTIDDLELEIIFQTFNGPDRPEDYTGRSLSVGDVVTLRKEKRLKAYFCENIGWKEIKAEDWEQSNE